MNAEVILHLLRHADRERTTGVPAGAAKVVNQIPLRWLQDSLRARRQHAGHPLWYVRAPSDHSNTPLHKADWAASEDTVLQNTPPGPRHAQLIVASHDGHLDLRPPTMRTIGEVAQPAQTDHALTHRGHTPLGAAHATAYVHARDLTATASNHRALRARDSHTPVQRRLRVCKERLSGVAVLPQPCLLCCGPEETPGHMHVECAHSRLLWTPYRQAVHEVARHLPPGDKALWVASWRSAGAAWTEVFRSGLVPEEAEAQLHAIALYDPPVGDLRGRLPPPHVPARRFRMGASQPQAGATPPRAPKRGGPGTPMAHCGRGQLPPPSPAPWQGFRSLPPCCGWHSGVPARRGPPPVPGPAGGFLDAPARRPLPTVDHRARLHDRVGGTHSG